MDDRDGWNELIGVARVERADGPVMDGEGVGLYWRWADLGDDLWSPRMSIPTIPDYEAQFDCGTQLWRFLLGDMQTWADPIPYSRFDVVSHADGEACLWTFPVVKITSARREASFLVDQGSGYAWRVTRLAAAYGTREGD